MRIVHCVQGEAEWFQEHIGKVTASNASKILDFTAQKDGNRTDKSKEGAKRRKYRYEKVAEILSMMGGFPRFVSSPMLAGTAAEPLARTDYEFELYKESGQMVQEVGIVIGDDERSGWSPDGIVTDEVGAIIGAIEIKGPLTTTHLETIDNIALKLETIPEENLPQLWMAFVECETLQWIDFITRDGGMEVDKHVIATAKAEGTDLRILPKWCAQITMRLNRADCLDKIEMMRAEKVEFLADVDATIERIKSICPELPEPDTAPQGDNALGYLDDSYFEGLT
jgi:hypothetical protein